ncbi:MAG: chromosome partitioning protein ParA [Bacteroidia bacterium]|nr:chromosome partitioning protein ParA [Bacteroidia bacterium]MBT8269083.1 chromosome partitioning protein ParA [Bacteroidia bacterium]NNF81719.1 chromosome partitioning protein ParA [Flavobacteriaceae bacterium]NNK69839.1 chromosome partitioning protein ParA [Flavobacteriaceae bacterium]NNL79223.1 chromosome partitioning protein ParA [Flavobacteriaceae bacterium]
MENKTESKSKSLKVVLGVVVALLLATAFYTFKLYNDGKETASQLRDEKSLVLKDLNNMAEQYDIAISENQTANTKLVEARERIKELIDSLQVSENSVKSLWRYKKKYMTLQEEMDDLLAENDSLKVENQLLATSLDSTKVQLEERTVFTDSLLAQNTQLADIVEEAAVLSTVNLNGFGVIVRSSGKLIPTERARRTDKIRVCYTVAKNSLVESGDKEFFVQVIDPKNNVIGLNQQIQFEEKVLNYSLVSKFNYENMNLDVCEFITAAENEDFEKGRYVVNVFNQGDLVSTSQFTLK